MEELYYEMKPNLLIGMGVLLLVANINLVVSGASVVLVTMGFAIRRMRNGQRASY